MNRSIIFYLCNLVMVLVIPIAGISQPEANVYTENEGSTVKVLVDNNEVIPVSVALKLNVSGMTTQMKGDKGIAVVPAKTKGFLVAEASPKSGARKLQFGYESTIMSGDITLTPDLDHLYTLPIAPDTPVVIYQGYNGSFSHKGKKALDFGLEVGDGVYAARAGTVTMVIEHNTKGCKRSSCNKYNNIVTIYHADGTFAEYVHLDTDGALVEVGDEVAAGELIGYSGNTGWSSGPHLHFMVYHYDDNEQRSLKTKFITKEKTGIYLKEKASYMR